MLYREKLEVDYVFSLYKDGRAKHIIEVDKRLDNTHFFFLINYLKYPENIDYNPIINGYCIATDNAYFSDELNNVIQVFAPKNESITDVIQVVTENNKAIQIDFSGKVEAVTIEKSFETMDFTAHSNNAKQVVKLPEKLAEDEKLGLNYNSFSKRFAIISISYIILLLSSIYFIDSKEYNNYFVYLIIAPFGWLIFEHDYLFKTKTYIKMLLFSITLVLIGMCVARFKLLKSPALPFAILCSPFVFLIMQKALSSIYMAIFKRRPDIIDRSFVEVIFYQIPLFVLPVIISILLLQLFDFS